MMQASNLPTIDPQQMTQLLHLLQLAQCADNSKQSEVFQALSSIEERPASYIYLAYIFSQNELAVALRQLAGLTLSNFLKRNKNVVHLQVEQSAQIKAAVLGSTTPELANVRSMIISQLITRANFDYQLFGELVAVMGSNAESVPMVSIILEDIRLNNENYNLFEDPRFWTIMEGIYGTLLTRLQQELTHEAPNAPRIKAELKCLNLLTFHCPSRLYPYLTSYLEAVIRPILLGAFPTEIVQVALEGANQIAATKFSLVSAQLLEVIICFRGVEHSADLQKTWSNIMIEVIENDENSTLQTYLHIVLPRAIEGLTFTPQDQRAIRQEMEVEYNPYGQQGSVVDQEEQQEEETQILEASYGGTSGYTLRKLSFQLIEKIAIHFSEQLWSQWATYVGQRLASPVPAISETAISFIGNIAETCMFDMGEDLQPLLRCLSERAAPPNCALVRASSLWALEKLLPAFKEYDGLVQECLRLALEGLHHGSTSEGTHTTHLMLKEASISLLDELLCLESVPRIVDPQATERIVGALLEGLSGLKGRALFSIFKALSSIFESEHFRRSLPQETCNHIVGELCRKWSICVRLDSVMCPLLECLITAYEGFQRYLSKYNPEFIGQLLPLLHAQDRKQLVLRCIDFLSALVSSGHPNLRPTVESNGFVEMLCGLLVAEEKEVRHFAYALVSDVAKNYDLIAHFQRLVLLIAQTMDNKSLSSRNNALMCLTDLLERYFTLAQKFFPEVLAQTINIIKTEELESVFAFNFARMVGRLFLLDIQEGRRQLLLYPRLVVFCFLALRTRQITKMTSDSFRGLLAVLDTLSPVELQLVAADLECVLEALVCYPVRRQESAQNEALISVFSNFARRLREKLGEQAWIKLLQRPIFLPAAVRTLSEWAV